uniref:Uncharacterized protein n=1 Tax=Anguilla anguilla TaxID=7936 RepID=A0A0E9VWP7_ANGAN
MTFRRGIDSCEFFVF